jgi:hypothetical protein
LISEPDGRYVRTDNCSEGQPCKLLRTHRSCRHQAQEWASCSLDRSLSTTVTIDPRL